jgi:hypothetical protein
MSCANAVTASSAPCSPQPATGAAGDRLEGHAVGRATRRRRFGLFDGPGTWFDQEMGATLHVSDAGPARSSRRYRCPAASATSAVTGRVPQPSASPGRPDGIRSAESSADAAQIRDITASPGGRSGPSLTAAITPSPAPASWPARFARSRSLPREELSTPAAARPRGSRRSPPSPRRTSPGVVRTAARLPRRSHVEESAHGRRPKTTRAGDLGPQNKRSCAGDVAEMAVEFVSRTP